MDSASSQDYITILYILYSELESMNLFGKHL